MNKVLGLKKDAVVIVNPSEKTGGLELDILYK